MIKRIGAVLSLSLIMIMMTASFTFAGTQGLELKDQYPHDGDTGTAVENVSIKLWFNQDVKPKTDAIRKSNKAAVKLVDEKGKEVPIYLAYNPKDKTQAMVLGANNAKIQGDTTYTLTIDSSFQASNGATLTGGDKVSFKTLNQSRAMTVNMVIMGVMMVGMIFFSMRSVKKQQEKEKAGKGKTDTVNPYKEAKKTGKSVEEIVAKDQKNKEKQAAAAAKRAAKNAKDKKESKENHITTEAKRVAGPRPISAAGSTYKPPKKKKPAQKSNKGTTKPKNQTGKQKNKKKK